MEPRKRICKHWEAGSCKWGDNCRFIHAGSSGSSDLNIQSIALAEKARAINDSALLQQQLAVNRVSQQNLLQQGGMPSQHGIMRQGAVPNQLAILQQGLMPNQQSLLPQGAVANQLLTQGVLPQGSMSSQLDLLPGAPGLLGPMPSTLINPSSLSLLQQQQLQQQQLQQRQLQQQQLQRQQQMLEMQQLQLLHQQKLLASQDVAGLQSNMDVGFENLQATQHQNLMQSQMSSSAGNTPNLTSMADEVQTFGQAKKKKSRFHNSNEVLLPSLDVAKVGDGNPGSGGGFQVPSPAVMSTIGQTMLDPPAGDKLDVNPLQMLPMSIGASTWSSQQQSQFAQTGQGVQNFSALPVVVGTQMPFSTSKGLNISTATLTQMHVPPDAQIPLMSTASQVQLSSSQLGKPGSVGQEKQSWTDQMSSTVKLGMLGSVDRRSLSSTDKSSSTGTSTEGVRRKRSRFDGNDNSAISSRHDSFPQEQDFLNDYHDNYSEPRAEDFEAEYQPEDPTDVDDDYIEDFVEKLMSGSKPKIIQPDDSKKRKGITIKDMSIPKRKTHLSHKPGKELVYTDKSDFQCKEKNSRRYHDVYHDDERNFSYETDRHYEGREGTQLEQMRSFTDEHNRDRHSRRIYDVHHVTVRNNPPTRRERRLRDSSLRHESSEDFETDMANRYHSRRESMSGEDLRKWPESDTSNPVLPTFSVNKRQIASEISDSGIKRKEDEIGVVPAREVCYGHDLPVSVAIFMKSRGKYKPGLEAMTKNFKLPVNCIGLTPPKMKAEVWEILKKNTQTGDDILQAMQRWFATGVIPLILQVDHIGKALQDRQTVYRYTSDSLDALTYVLSSISIRRRLLLRVALPNKLAILCRRTAPMTASLLFGDTLPKDLLEVMAGRFHVPASEKSSLDVNNDDPLGDDFKPMFFPNLAIPGPPVDDSVANIINMACANDGDMSDLRNRYKIPRNCEALTPPAVNLELFRHIASFGLELDNRLQDVHLSIAEGMLPMMILLRSVHENNYDENQAVTLLTDALLLLGNAAYQINKVRMLAMRESLPEQIRHFCGYVWPGADTVPVGTFGNNL